MIFLHSKRESKWNDENQKGHYPLMSNKTQVNKHNCRVHRTEFVLGK